MQAKTLTGWTTLTSVCLLLLAISLVNAQTILDSPTTIQTAPTWITNTTPYASASDHKPSRPEPDDPTLNHDIFEDFINGSPLPLLEKVNQLASAGGGSGRGWMAGPIYEDAWGVKVVVDPNVTEAIFLVDGVQVAAAHSNFATGNADRYTAESNTDGLSGATPFVSRRFDYARFRVRSDRASRL